MSAPVNISLTACCWLVSAIWVADEAIQADALDEVFQPERRRRARPRGGDRVAQAARYHLKNRGRRRGYWRVYRAARRAAQRAAEMAVLFSD